MTQNFDAISGAGGLGSGGVGRDNASAFPNPYADISSAYVPTNIKDAFDYCSPKGTDVELDQYGTLTDISQLVPGTKVLTSDSTLDVVDKTGSRDIDEDIYVITSSGIRTRPLRVTKEHPVLIYDSTEPQYDLAKSFHYVPASDVKAGMYTITPLPRYEENYKFKVSPYLCGSWLAEGHIMWRNISGLGRIPGGVAWTIGSHETAFSDKIKTEVLASFPEANVICRTTASRPDVTRIEVNNRELAEYLLHICGQHAHGKKLAPEVFHASIDEKIQFISGWMDGDGAIQKNCGLCGCTVSRQLAWQLYRLALSTNSMTSILEIKQKHNGRAITDQSGKTWKINTSQYMYHVVISVYASRKFFKYMYKQPKRMPVRLNRDNGVLIRDGYALRKIVSVKKERYRGAVYNIRVANKHNYVSNGISVHNCEHMVMTMPPFRAVIQRVVRYFLTSLEIHGASDTNRQKYEDFFSDQLHLMQQLGEIGEDVMIYGNSFVSLYLPFKRMLTCPKCGLCLSAEEIDYDFIPKTMEFKGYCNKCKEVVSFKRDDRRSTDQSKIRMVRWDPKRMDLRVHPVSGKTEFFYRLDDRMVERINSGRKEDQFYINESPWEFVEAACHNKGGNDRKFKFKDDAIYHFKMTTPAGLDMRGWGMPPLLSLYKLAYYVQMMRRYDEAIAMDFIVPFRVVFPQGTSNVDGQDPLTMTSMRTFVAAMQGMIARKRKNLTDVQIAPYPIGYQMLGGEGKSLVPKDVVKEAQDELLNALGYPIDLYQGTLQLQAAPVALRVFEKHWQFVVDGFNDIINWSMKTIARHLGWDPITGKLASVTLADDVERKALLLQSAAGQDISKSTAYKVFGIDYIKEQKRIAQEQMEIQAIQQRAMAASMATQMNGGYNQPAGEGGGEEDGMPSAGMEQMGQTPGDVWAQAGTIARQLVLNTPPTQVRGQLLRLKQTNPTLHSQVKQQMDDLRSQLRSQGQTMAMQAAQQGGM